MLAKETSTQNVMVQGQSRQAALGSAAPSSGSGAAVETAKALQGAAMFAAGHTRASIGAEASHQSLMSRVSPLALCAPLRFRKLSGVLLALAMIVPGWCAAEHNPLLPRPQEIHYGNGNLALQGLTICFASNPGSEDRFAAAELSHALSERAKAPIPIREGARCEHGILLERTGGINALPVPGELPGPDSREAYSLKIAGDGVKVTARSSAGLFYAVQTLKQLVE
ncbi:MAG: glycoside hydrolase family 20 zincin-like fold domain-containing protein, partial [Acidobacteriota bacterium]|nr:glycoside hydrolase family 20 zincin-like fold domain-containing protein [Acidobacteriota bacterium]